MFDPQRLFGAGERSFVPTALVNLDTVAPFIPWHDKFAIRSAPSIAESHDPVPEVAIDLDAVRLAAYAEGLAAGRATVESEVAAERDAVLRLAEALEQYRPEPPAELATLLAEAVSRLVHQIVGEVAIDNSLLERRVAAVASIIADSAGPHRMRLHPDDIERLAMADLDVELVPDAGLLPGSLFVETGTGWVEDGPDVGLEKLRQALDRMAISQ